MKTGGTFFNLFLGPKVKLQHVTPSFKYLISTVKDLFSWFASLEKYHNLKNVYVCVCVYLIQVEVNGFKANKFTFL